MYTVNILIFPWYFQQTFFAPFVNKTLKYYQVPHRFRIRLVCTRAICQYMLFTPPSGLDASPVPFGENVGDVYLPIMPEGIMTPELVVENANGGAVDVPLLRMGIVNGISSLHQELNVTQALNKTTPEQRKTINVRLYF